jgi:hypothetical protein
MPRNQPKIPGFKYTREGVHVSMTQTQWRELNHTHQRRVVVSGETWFINRETNRLEFEAYGHVRQ